MKKRIYPKLCPICGYAMKVIDPVYRYPLNEFIRQAKVCKCEKCGSSVITDDKIIGYVTEKIKGVKKCLYMEDLLNG